MKRTHFAWLICLGLASVSAPAASSDAPAFTVQVPGADKLMVTVPPVWKHTTNWPPAGIPADC